MLTFIIIIIIIIIIITPSLFEAQRPSTYSQVPREHRLIYERLEWGGKKWRAGAQKQQCL